MKVSASLTASTRSGHLARLLESALGARRAAWLLDLVEVPLELELSGRSVSRACLAEALALVLLDDVLERVPLARAYALETRAAGRPMVLDHGALRTVAAPCGGLPAGSEAFRRILEPLGYRVAGHYPLDRLGMTGHAFAHLDLPESIPQYFVSELHPERFSPAFQEAVQRVVGESRDPLPATAHTLLDRLEREGCLSLAEARELLPLLAACFERQHPEPALADHELLLAESAEMAWIATEGNAFNHATDRVDDVLAVAAHQRALGRPVKDEVERSASGRVHQTAFRAAEVERLLRADDGHLVRRRVPGSFHEFITRHRLPDGRLDLAFDAGNAQSIFRMTTLEGTLR